MLPQAAGIEKALAPGTTVAADPCRSPTLEKHKLLLSSDRGRDLPGPSEGREQQGRPGVPMPSSLVQAWASPGKP